VAASSAVELVLVGPVRSATVVAATPHATYLDVADPNRTLLCLASASAVRVPCALVLESRAFPPQPPIGTAARVGGGVVALDSGGSFRVQRWWRPPRPRGLGTASPARLAAGVGWLTGHVADPLDEGGRAAVAGLVALLTAPGRSGSAVPVPPEADLTASVRRLIGRGPGLTPIGDDVLAGALVTLHALGSPLTAPLARAVRASAPGATTTVSAGLLRLAADGVCIPPLAALLTALAEGPAAAAPGGLAPAPVSEALARAAGALLSVGNTSGAGLLHGVLVAVAIAHARLAPGVLRTPTVPAPNTPALSVGSAA